MNSNNQNSDDDMNFQQLNFQQLNFKQLIKESEFDDSVDENHQRELRQKALEAFDQAQRTTPVERSTSTYGIAKRSPVRDPSPMRSGVWMATMAAAIAVCLLTVALLWFQSADDNPVNVIAERLSAEPIFPTDDMLVHVLTEISAWQADGSPDDLFRALEVSRREDEARQLERNSTRMRMFYESSL